MFSREVRAEFCSFHVTAIVRGSTDDIFALNARVLYPADGCCFVPPTLLGEKSSMRFHRNWASESLEIMCAQIFIILRAQLLPQNNRQLSVNFVFRLKERPRKSSTQLW
jgi:hypothetical protein